MITSDPSAVWRPVPRMGWRPLESRPIRYPHPRKLGALLGFAAGTVVVVAVVLAEAIFGFGLFDPVNAGDPGRDLGSSLVALLVSSALVGSTGALGGSRFGRAAFQAQGRVEWAWVVLALAFAAVFIGAFEVGIGGMLLTLPAQALSQDAVVALAFDVLAGAALALIGVVIYGIFVLPFTLAASALWAAGMWWLRRRLEPRPAPISR
jgi:hypothetical protein